MNEISQIGIEEIGFYTANAVFSLRELAKRNNQDVAKYTSGLSQEQMSIITPDEDIITMAYNAVIEFLNDSNKETIDLLLFATESAVDNSKSSACELHNLLNLSNSCRCLEIKHACYGGTGALMLAKNYVIANPDKKVLVVMSDIAFYGIHSKGEPTQGCGAVALLISSQPKIATFNNDSVFLTDNKNDFYRPIYQVNPIYDGHFSIKCYLAMFEKALTKYYQKNNSFDYLITHMPFAKMLDKCCKIANVDFLINQNDIIKKYCSIIGNTYTASLYIGFLSLLENSTVDLSGKQICLFSYGSGCECEMFSLTLLDGYKKYLHYAKHKEMIDDRVVLDYEQYCLLLKQFENREKSLNWKLDDDSYNFIPNDESKIRLYEINNGVRLYEKIFRQ